MNNTQQKRIVVVLGMHRSGTSVITRGLEVIGINLGDHLLSPAADNRKGFWEDVDINALNIDLLRALGHDWHTLTPVLPEEMATPAVGEFKLRAVEILRNKLSTTNCFGLKDPRIPRLLPFWQDVFAHLQVRVSYVIACRNPMSVARSLAKRDGFDLEKGYYLWLEHMLQSLVQTANQPRIVVDYDRLMEEPTGQLQRIAQNLGLTFDPESPQFAEYRTQFLEDSLRHTRYRMEDLHLDKSIPPIVIELYKILVELATDAVQFEHRDVVSLLRRVSGQFRENYPALHYMQACDERAAALAQQVADRDGRLAQLQVAVEAQQQTLAERDGQLNGLTQAVAERDARLAELDKVVTELEDGIAAVLRAMANSEEEVHHLARILHGLEDEQGPYAGLVQVLIERNHQIAGLRESVRERDERAAALAQQVAERDGQLAQLQAAVEAQQQTLTERDGQLNGLTQAVAERDEQVSSLSREVAENNGQLAGYREHVRQLETRCGELEYAVQAIRSSHSWKITAPLRSVTSVGRRLKGAIRLGISAQLKSIYHRVPLSASRKQQLKEVFFKYLGGMVSDSPSYKYWYMQQQACNIQGKEQSQEKESLAVPQASVASYSVTQWQADGRKEWEGYAEVKARIGDLEKRRRNSLRVAPYPIIQIDATNLESVLRRICLPVPGDNPEVSIIIPVFNQVQYTLECLISISERTGADIKYEVIIGDDASTDDTRRLLSRVDNLRVISHEKNLGFLRNCNQIAQEARGKHILFLNNDVQVTEGWLQELLATLKSEPLAGAAGPKIIYPSGYLQEAGAYLKRDGGAVMIGLNDAPDLPQYNVTRVVDYCSGACLLITTALFRELGGFDDRYAPAYCEDADLCMRIAEAGRKVVYCPTATIVHHLSKTSDSLNNDFKLKCIARNLQQFSERWQPVLDSINDVRYIAFYLPQYHPIPENDLWWGKGFTEWRNVAKAVPNFIGHYQPRQPADLGYYDLRLPEVMEEQAKLARRYGVYGFCFYYYWFSGQRLLETPIERMLQTGSPQFPYCLCWANENWTRRWDGMDKEVLIAQNHSDADDEKVILDLARHFRSPNYIRVNGRPLVLIYRVDLFPNFARTAERWREISRKRGIGEIYLVMVESFEMAMAGVTPKHYGCDAGVEFPPHGMAEPQPPSGHIINPSFTGTVADYRDIAVRFATREQPAYKRFMGVMPGWDNTARRQNNGFCFENATPGAFQAWLEAAVERTKRSFSGDERLIFINAWNEWAEGAYLEPDRRFGHTFMESVRNSLDAEELLRRDPYHFG